MSDATCAPMSAPGLLPDAHRLAHSLKGVSGSLELMAVQRIAAELERMLAAGEVEQARAEIVQLEAAIAPAIAAARTLEPGDAAASVPVAARADSAMVDARRIDLRDLLCRRSLGARAGFERFADAIGLDEGQRRDHPIHQALERLDYEAALSLLDSEREGVPS